MLWKLTGTAEQAIDGLRGEGIEPTPQEVLYIQQLSLDVEAPKSGISLCKGAPVEVGGATLWPLTIAASMWYGEISEAAWVGSSMKMEVFCMAFAMAHGHDPALPKLKGWRAKVAVRLWASRLRCTLNELAQAIADVNGDEIRVLSDKQKREANEPSRVSETTLAQDACVLCGGTPEFWERECSMAYVAELVTRGMRLKSALGGAQVEDSSEALAILAQYVREVREAHMAEAVKRKDGE